MENAHTISWEDAVRTLLDDRQKEEFVKACYYDLPLAGAAERFRQNDEWLAMREIIGTPRGVAVDIGAGNGIVSYALAKDGWQAVAVEPDPSFLVGAGAIRNLAKETNIKIDVREGFGEGLPVETGEAQLVVARQVMHHADDLPAFAKEIARVLAPGGMFVSTRDHVITGPDQLPEFLNAHPLHNLYGGENAFTTAQYRDAFTGAGMQIVSELGSFDSVINYAPQTPATIKKEIAARLGPFGFVAQAVLAPKLIFNGAMRVLSAMDRRAGRAVSFVCRKNEK